MTYCQSYYSTVVLRISNEISIDPGKRRSALELCRTQLCLYARFVLPLSGPVFRCMKPTAVGELCLSVHDPNRYAIRRGRYNQLQLKAVQT